jgi:NAD(P)H-hydrate epimerase
MARFLKITVQEVQARRLESAREAASRYNVYLVLKGAQTVVAAPDGRVSINPTGNPALASGGTGDVLTGLIGGFLAQYLVPWDAARLGVYLHGLAADYLIQTTGGRSLVAGDLLRVFPELVGKFLSGQVPHEEEGICFRLVMS